MTAFFWLNLAAILLSPVIAVVIGQYLQARAKKRDEKMQIFKTLMTSRAVATIDYVNACNTIDIVFADDKQVRKCWAEFYDLLCIENPTDTDKNKMATARDRLLEALAINLGYKDKITWETIQKPYLPKWLANSIKSQNDHQQLISGFAQIFETPSQKD